MLNVTFSVKIKSIVAFPKTIKVENELDGISSSFGISRHQEEKSIDYRKRVIATSYAGLNKENLSQISFAKEVGLDSGFVLLEHTNPENYLYSIYITGDKYLKIHEFKRRVTSKNLYTETKYVFDLLDKDKWKNLSELLFFIKQNMFLSVVNQEKHDLSFDEVYSYNLLEGQTNNVSEGYSINYSGRINLKGYPIPKTVSFKEYLGEELTPKDMESLVIDDTSYYIDYWNRYIYHPRFQSITDKRYSLSMKSISPSFFLHFIKGFNEFEVNSNVLNRRIIAEEGEYFSIKGSTKSDTFEIKKISGIVENGLVENLMTIDNRHEWNSKYRWS